MTSDEGRSWKRLLVWLAVGVLVAAVLEAVLHEFIGRDLARDIGTGVVVGVAVVLYNERNDRGGATGWQPAAHAAVLALVFVVAAQVLRRIGL